MKGILLILLIPGLILGRSMPSYASDWDKAGKALTIIEGVRILTGGKVDIVGALTGINEPDTYVYQTRHPRWHKQKYKVYSKRVWVPHLVWKKKYIPKHQEYDERYGKIIVEGHYIRYQVENGGRWAWK